MSARFVLLETRLKMAGDQGERSRNGSSGKNGSSDTGIYTAAVNSPFTTMMQSCNVALNGNMHVLCFHVLKVT